MLSQIQSTVPASLPFIHGGCSLCSLSFTSRNGRCTTRARAISRRAEKKRDDKGKEKGGAKAGLVEILERVAESSGMGARERRLLKVREAKRQKEYERNHAYPKWANKVKEVIEAALSIYNNKALCIKSTPINTSTQVKSVEDLWIHKFSCLRILEDGCKEDEELRAILGDSIGNPELMKQRIEERVIKKGRDFRKKETGSVVAFKVSFRDFNPLNSHIWIELYGEATDRDVDLLGSAIQSWYVMGRLGAFNSSNLQLANESMTHNPLYDSEMASTAMPSSFHDISDVEFQDSWARFWVDLGTSDFFALDVLLNCLTMLSSDYLGIKQVVFGGRRHGDWEEGMRNPEFGYKSFKI